jgi:hypothetical protein
MRITIDRCTDTHTGAHAITSVTTPGGITTGAVGNKAIGKQPCRKALLLGRLSPMDYRRTPLRISLGPETSCGARTEERTAATRFWRSTD